METDERLLPVPEVKGSKTGREIQTQAADYPAAYSPMYDDDSFADRRSIREYFNIIYKRLPYILAITILTTAAAAFYMYRQPSVYLAMAEMIIEPRKPQPQNTQSVNINFGVDQNYYNTQLELLQNPELMKTVIIELGLHRQNDLLGNKRRGVLTTIRSMFSGGEIEKPKVETLPILAADEFDEFGERKQENLTAQEVKNAETYAAHFARKLTVEQVSRTNLVKIMVQDENPKLAAELATAVAKVFMTQDVEIATSGQKKAFNELTQSISELKDNIAVREREYIQRIQSSGLPLGEGKTNDLRAQVLSRLSGQLLDAIDERRKLEAQYSAARTSKNPYGLYDSSGSQVASELRSVSRERVAKLDDELRQIDTQIKDAETELVKLRVKYTDEYVKVKEAKAEIAKLKATRERTYKTRSARLSADSKKLESEVQKDITSGLAAKLQSARKREGQLRASYEKELTTANFQGVEETKLTTLKREIETKRALLDTYLQRQKEQELALNTSRPDNIKISAEAQTPVLPIGPQRTRNIVIAFLVSLVGGIGLTFLLDYLDDSIRSSDDVGRHVGLPTLALIPHHNSMEKRTLKMLGAGGGRSGGATSSALIALEDNRSAMAEAYRHLRTSLLFSSAGKPPETILVTSSQPSEGKTTTAINTAITLAQSGAEVVLVDCDLRRPRLHSHFNMENTHGLTNYLSGERDTDNLLKPFPHLPNLKIITSGPIPPNPAELLSSNEMKHLLQFLRGNFNHVVVDSPPAISFTDAAILSTIVDGVVLVAMSGKSSIHLMRRFKQRLGNIGARIYGVVLNGIKSNSVEYGYYGYGYTYNYYEHDESDSTPRMGVANDNGLSDDLSEEEFDEDDIEFIDDDK